MSATRDKSQKTTFVYSNLYQLYRKSKDAARPEGGATEEIAGETRSSFYRIPSERNVLKTSDLKREAIAPKVEPFTPPELMGKRLEELAAQTAQANATRLTAVPREVRIPVGKPVSPVPESAVSGLKQNLQMLQDLHARLRFMLKELEALTQDE